MVEARISLEQKPPKERVRLMRFGRLVKGVCSWSPPAPPGELTSLNEKETDVKWEPGSWDKSSTQ